MNGSREFTIYCDGGTRDDGEEAGVGAAVIDERGLVVVEGAQLIGPATSNQAEYRALSYGISLANLVGCTTANFVSDSQVVVQQVGGWWAIRANELEALHSLVNYRMMTSFDWWSIQHVARDRNRYADWLVCRALGHKRTLKHQPDPPAYIARESGTMRPGWSNVPRSARNTRVEPDPAWI